MNLQGIIFATLVFISCFCVTEGTCPSGKYGFNCTLSCPENCKYDQCHPGDGSCNGCDSKFWGQFCNLSCSALCSSDCDQYHGNCQSCIAGRWKQNCTQQCPGYCDSRGCDIRTGICIYKCLKGYYGAYCNLTCPLQCPDCKRESGSCQQCNNGYYGTFCDLTCPLHCIEKCDKATGHCYGCLDGYWGLNCTETCEHLCLCDQLTGNCTKCRPGHCGQTCEKTCPYNVWRCIYRSCEKDTCECSACQREIYMGKNCEQVCPYPCYRCTMNGTCKSCLTESKRYGPDCTIECKNCQGNCDFFTGYCEECKNGTFGEKCENTCTVNCKRCDRTTGQCLECLAGFWGDKCNRTCPENCKRCDKTTGQCLECLAGFWGDKCNRTCPENCNLKECDRQSGYCLSCAGHAYGTNCEKPCSPYCLLQEYDRNREICDREGVCLHQCQIGWWGSKCEDACINCKASKCFHDTGICEKGCLSGYEMNRNNNCMEVGSISNKSTTTAVTQSADSTDPGKEVDANSANPINSNKSNLSVASFVIGIVILVMILAIAGVYLFVKTRHGKDVADTSSLQTINHPRESQEYEEPRPQITDAPMRSGSQISTVSGEYMSFGSGTDGYDSLTPREQHPGMNQ